MATSETPRHSHPRAEEYLELLCRSGVLSESRGGEIRARMLDGAYPIDPGELSRRLVEEGLLTEYQARKLAGNKPGSLMIGRYVVLEKIGSGSMGRVYKARHRMMDRFAALKIIAPEISNNERVVARFQREMRLVGKLDHPNVVRAFDADIDKGTLYIAMEYVGGDSLGQRLKTRGVVPPAELVGYISQAARGLQHAHDQGIVHRDIKPSNLLVGLDGTVKVLDLGLATLMEADEQSAFATADGVAVGTIDYMSPEQASGRDVTPVSDQFSLGCTMYHLLTGRLPFPGDSPIERLGARIAGAPVPVREHRPDLPPRFVEVLNRLLANRPGDRFRTANEAADALQSLIRKRTTAVPGASVAPSKPVAKVPPASPAPAPPPKVKVVHKEPEYPSWFQPLAKLAERSGVGALFLLLGLFFLAFASGVLLGWAF